MYSNYKNIPMQYGNQMPNNSMQYPYSSNDDRLVGGFVFPFLLGGVTGAAIAPAFWRPGYGYRPYQPYGYRPYGPYYR